MKHKKDSNKTIEKDKKHHHFILKISIVLIVFIFLIFKFTNIIVDSLAHQEVKAYFEENGHNVSVQDFMHLRMISKEFNIDNKKINEILDFKVHPRDSTKPLRELCNQKKLNCTEIIKELNEASNRKIKDSKKNEGKSKGNNK